MNASAGSYRVFNFAVGLAMLAAIWAADRLVAGEVSMSILYLLPIGYVAWYCGGAWAYAASLLSAAAWLQADIATGRPFSHWYVPYWNATVRFGFFLVVAALTSAIIRMRELYDLEREVSELKSDMVSLVNHEFGNFLTTFKLTLTLLKETDDERAAASRAKWYAALERVHTHLSAAVANFLNLNRIDSGRFVPEIRLTKLRTLIHETVALLGPVLENKPVSLRLKLPQRPVSVQADPDALAVVMTNLISNAFKYTPAGGGVTISVSLESGPGTAVVAVEDTGIGIRPEDQDRIFSGSYRAKDGRKLAKGFGVGLKVARELLESQGTRLEIDSVPGRGSRFSFRLPLWHPPPPRARQGGGTGG